MSITSAVPGSLRLPTKVALTVGILIGAVGPVNAQVVRRT